jgi:hypothetical protein
MFRRGDAVVEFNDVDEDDNDGGASREIINSSISYPSNPDT